MKKLFAILLAAVLTLTSGPGAWAAEKEASAVFTASSVDRNGLFTVELTLKDVTFNAFQFTIGFDTQEVTLADENGNAADEPAKYQENLSGGWLTEIGCEADNDKGYWTFTGFIMPGQAAKTPVNEDGTATAPASGLSVFRFRFKRLGEIKNGFRLAYDLGTTAIVGPDGRIPMSVNFALPDEKSVTLTAAQVEKLEEENKPEKETSSETPSESSGKLSGTVALQPGNSAAAVDGKRQTIYPGESGVSPYTVGNFLYVPLRFVAEKLGATVTWHRETRTVTIERDTLEAVVTLDSSDFTVNGRPMTAERPVTAKNNRTMVSPDVLEKILSLKMTTGDGLVVFAPAGSPLLSSGVIDEELSQDINLLLSPLVGLFAGKDQ